MRESSLRPRNGWEREHWLGYAGQIPGLRELSGTDWRVYLLVDAEARRTAAGCTLGVETMARQLGVGERTIRRSMKRLQTAGLVFSLRRCDLPSVRFAIDPLDAGALRRIRSGIDWHEVHQGRAWAEAARSFFNRWRPRIQRRRCGIRASLPVRLTTLPRPAPKGGHLCHPSEGVET